MFICFGYPAKSCFEKTYGIMKEAYGIWYGLLNGKTGSWHICWELVFHFFLLTLLKTLLSLDDSASRVQHLCHFAQFCFIVSALLLSLIINNSDLQLFCGAAQYLPLKICWCYSLAIYNQTLRLSLFDGSNKFLQSDWQRIRLFQSIVVTYSLKASEAF